MGKKASKNLVTRGNPSDFDKSPQVPEFILSTYGMATHYAKYRTFCARTKTIVVDECHTRSVEVEMTLMEMTNLKLLSPQSVTAEKKQRM